MSDLFGNHIVGFPTRRLKYVRKCLLKGVGNKKLTFQNLSHNGTKKNEDSELSYKIMVLHRSCVAMFDSKACMENMGTHLADSLTDVSLLSLSQAKVLIYYMTFYDCSLHIIVVKRFGFIDTEKDRIISRR